MTFSHSEGNYDTILMKIKETLDEILEKDERIYAVLVIDESGHYVTHAIRSNKVKTLQNPLLGELEYIASAISGVSGLSKEMGHDLGVTPLYSILLEFEKVNVIIVSKQPYSLAIMSDKSLLPGTLRVLALKTLEKISQLLFELQNAMKKDLQTTLKSIYTELEKEGFFEISESDNWDMS